MGHGAISVFTATIASGATLSAEIDIARAWGKVLIDPTGLGSEVRIQVAPSTGGTYRQLYFPAANSVSGIVKVGSAASGGAIEVPAGYRFMKVETTAAVANGGTAKIYCSDM